ncbi:MULTISPECIES: DUF952 domain-containing protein [unclassified Mycobacterium]|uniref:DUF952 domain-containing protein n=1 Tax=unclassified Mycobacterium TaxID=2642494 RepID=UPI0029C6B464|nr:MULTISPECIES: DUF952 domain-containing protein [unclassified Mycobacterium]
MIAAPRIFVHLCTTDEWRAAERLGLRKPPSLDDVGFVHLSAPQQVHLPANRLYAGRTDMVLLQCDPASLDAPVRWEPGVPGDPEAMRFPHLYGPLPMAAVTSITPYGPGADGRFPELSEEQLLERDQELDR